MSRATRQKDGDDKFELSADEQAARQQVPAKEGSRPRLVRDGVQVDQALPGMEEVVDQELLDLAGNYLTSKADFKRASEIVTQDKNLLFEAMGKRQKEAYEHAGIRISIVKTTKRSLKVETFEDPTTAESETAAEKGGEGESAE